MKIFDVEQTTGKLPPNVQGDVDLSCQGIPEQHCIAPHLGFVERQRQRRMACRQIFLAKAISEIQ